jgi:hypothetical protein
MEEFWPISNTNMQHSIEELSLLYDRHCHRHTSMTMSFPMTRWRKKKVFANFNDNDDMTVKNYCNLEFQLYIG